MRPTLEYVIKTTAGVPTNAGDGEETAPVDMDSTQQTAAAQPHDKATQLDGKLLTTSLTRSPITCRWVAFLAGEPVTPLYCSVRPPDTDICICSYRANYTFCFQTSSNTFLLFSICFLLALVLCKC